MIQKTPQEIRGEAIAWHLRLREGASADWDAFVQWLEQDPAHSDAFDTISRADAAIEPEAVPLHGQPTPANDQDRDEATTPTPGEALDYRPGGRRSDTPDCAHHAADDARWA
jgi:transmembrane sensor